MHVIMLKPLNPSLSTSCVFGNKTREELNELSGDKKKIDPLFEKNVVNEHYRKFGITYKRFTNGQECSFYKDLAKNTEQLKKKGLSNFFCVFFTHNANKHSLFL